VLDNVFLRAEYNYIAFSGFNGSNVTIHNVQAGLAVKY
jgi:opacity protein-like surface antigen